MKNRKLIAILLVVVLGAPALIAAVVVLMRTRSAETASGPATEVVVFDGATGWKGARATCTETNNDPRCDSQWTHADSGQVVRVFVFDVADARALDSFVQKLATDVTAKGGVVDRFTQGDLQVVRYLQEIDGGASGKVAAINYALIARNANAVYLISTLAPFDLQREADERVRKLLESAKWTKR